MYNTTKQARVHAELKVVSSGKMFCSQHLDLDLHKIDK